MLCGFKKSEKKKTGEEKKKESVPQQYQISSSPVKRVCLSVCLMNMHLCLCLSSYSMKCVSSDLSRDNTPPPSSFSSYIIYKSPAHSYTFHYVVLSSRILVEKSVWSPPDNP